MTPIGYEGLETTVALIDQRTEWLKDEVTKISKKLDSHYVTQQEFVPIKKAVYGVIALVLIEVSVAVIALVVR
jgi:hypothetical protein